MPFHNNSHYPMSDTQWSGLESFDHNSHYLMFNTQWSGSGFSDMENEDEEELLSKMTFPLTGQGSFERLDLEQTDQMQPVAERSITSFNNQVYNEIILNTTDLPTTSSIKWPEELVQFQEYETDFHILLQKGWASNLPRPLNYYYGFKPFSGKEHESLLVGKGQRLSKHTLWNIFKENFMADFYVLNSRNGMSMPDFDSDSAAKIRSENALDYAHRRLNLIRNEKTLTSVVAKGQEYKLVLTNQRPNYRLYPEQLTKKEFGKTLLYILDIRTKERNTLMPQLETLRNPYSRKNLLNEMQYCKKLETEWKKQFKSVKEVLRTNRTSDQHRMLTHDASLTQDAFMSNVRADKITKLKSHLLSVTKDVNLSVDQKKTKLERITEIIQKNNYFADDSDKNEFEKAFQINSTFSGPSGGGAQGVGPHGVGAQGVGPQSGCHSFTFSPPLNTGLLAFKCSSSNFLIGAVAFGFTYFILNFVSIFFYKKTTPNYVVRNRFEDRDLLLQPVHIKLRVYK
jgi:hypothetical protein